MGFAQLGGGSPPLYMKGMIGGQNAKMVANPRQRYLAPEVRRGLPVILVTRGSHVLFVSRVGPLLIPTFKLALRDLYARKFRH